MLAMPGHRIGSRLPIEFFEHLKQSHDLERRAAKRVRLRACKSRWRAGSIDNFGFQIIDPHHNWIVAEENSTAPRTMSSGSAPSTKEGSADNEPDHLTCPLVKNSGRGVQMAADAALSRPHTPRR